MDSPYPNAAAIGQGRAEVVAGGDGDYVSEAFDGTRPDAVTGKVGLGMVRHAENAGFVSESVAAGLGIVVVAPAPYLAGPVERQGMSLAGGNAHDRRKPVNADRLINDVVHGIGRYTTQLGTIIMPPAPDRAIAFQRQGKGVVRRNGYDFR